MSVAAAGGGGGAAAIISSEGKIIAKLESHASGNGESALIPAA